MNNWARQLCRSALIKSSNRSDRRIIALRQDKDYKLCIRELLAAGIIPIKTEARLRLICCHFDRRTNWKQLSRHPRVAYMERDHQVKAHASPSKQKEASPNAAARIPWNVSRVLAPPAWKPSNYGVNIKVAIIDTGIAPHPDLHIVGGVNTIGGKSYRDDNGHGTHVAGIAAAVGRKRIYGVAPKVSLYAVKVLDSSGSGYVTDIIEGINWCLSRGIKIMNMSFGLMGESKALRAAIRRASSKGAIMVASAGNSGKLFSKIDAPARYPEMIAVGATTRVNRVASFSSRGKGIDLSAPGVHILSTWLDGAYRRESGTSMSSPHVTGGVALLRAIKPRICVAAVSRQLKQAALRIPGGRNAVGQGLLQIKPAACKLIAKTKG